MAVDNKPLENFLEELFHQLQKKGLLPPGLDKTNIIKNMVQQLNQAGFRPEDLDPKKNPDTFMQVRKALMLCMVNESVVNKTGDPSLRINYRMLFAPKGPQNKEELELELRKLLNALNMQLKRMGLKPLDEEKINKICKELAGKLTAGMKPYEKNLSQSDESMNLLSLANMSVGALIGGVDPANPGLVRLVQYINGDPLGFIDNMAGGGQNFMSRRNTPEPGKPNAELYSSLINDLAIADNSVLSALESFFAPTPTHTISPFADIAKGPPPPGERK